MAQYSKSRLSFLSFKRRGLTLFVTVAALLARPSTSKDKILNFVSDVVSQQEIADLVASASGRPVEPDYVSEEEAHAYVAHPETIPERARQSRFDAAFWYIVRIQQGAPPSPPPPPLSSLFSSFWVLCQ